MPKKFGQALAYASLIWMIGFVWGSIVFMTPSLKNIASVPYVSRYPAISFPILLIWVVLTYLLSRSYLRSAPDKPSEGLRLGLMFAAVNFLLDLLVLVWLFGNGAGYFAALTIWAAYLMLVVVPWWVGRQTEASAAT